MSDSIQQTPTVKDPASDCQDSSIGQIGVFSEQACLLSSDLGPELLEVARKQLAFSRPESEQVLPQERRKPFEDGESTCGIKRPESHFSARTRDLAPEAVGARLDVLLIGASAEDGVRSGEALAGASRNGSLDSESAFEQTSKKFLGGLASKRGQGVPDFEAGKLTEALLEALGSEGIRQSDHAIQQHGSASLASNCTTERVRLEVLDALLAEVELAGSGSEPGARKRPNPVGLAGVGGTGLVDSDKNFKAAHESTPNQLGGACR